MTVSEKQNDTRTIIASQTDPGFVKEVASWVDINPGTCLTCLMCSGGCPFFQAMDYGPHGVMRLIQYGLRRAALESNTIWLCVGCHTCSYVCPMAIDVAAVMDVLKQMALAEGVPIAQQSILDFHREVLDSVKKYGRTHKLEIMLRYKVRRRTWFQDMDIGLKMLAKRRLDLRPSKIKDPKTLKQLFSRNWKR